jgi:hypothetical protein
MSKLFFLQNKGKAKKNEALKEKLDFFYCIENIIPRKFTIKIRGFFLQNYNVPSFGNISREILTLNGG